MDQLLARLAHVRRVAGGYRALCPVHADHTPSLSIREIDGHVTAHCFSCGAGTRAVFAVVGLPWGGRQEPLTSFTLALAIGRSQDGYRRRQAYHASDLARRMDHAAGTLRSAATALGDTETAWEILDTAAAIDRDAQSIAP